MPWPSPLWQGSPVPNVQVELLHALYERVRKVGEVLPPPCGAHTIAPMLPTCTPAQAATTKGVCLMVDAEHSCFQPAIDHCALQMMVCPAHPTCM